MGYHRSLVEPLLKEDAASAERALLRFSGRLGALHATTVGHSAKFERLFTAVSPGVWVRAQDVPNVGERVKQLQACLDRVGVHANTDETREWEAVINVTDNPGPFLSYIHGDPCPDNVFLIDDELRLIDFEFGRFGHALMDGTYGRMAFPTCWCANRLPHGLVSKMEAVYRTELAKGCSDAQEDRIFERAVVEACGFWLFNTLGRHLDGALEADHTWGIATMRQRLLARLEAFVDVAEDVDQLPGLRGIASRVLEELAKRWPGRIHCLCIRRSGMPSAIRESSELDCVEGASPLRPSPDRSWFIAHRPVIAVETRHQFRDMVGTCAAPSHLFCPRRRSARGRRWDCLVRRLTAA